MYSKKLLTDGVLAKKLRSVILLHSRDTFRKSGGVFQGKRKLAYMLATNKGSILSADSTVKLLINGEQKFPEALKALNEAKNHIHIEYYIYEDGEIGKSIEQVLIQKAKEGVEVRFIYDDFGSRSIRRKMARRLKDNGVKAFSFSRIIFTVLVYSAGKPA